MCLLCLGVLRTWHPTGENEEPVAQIPSQTLERERESEAWPPANHQLGGGVSQQADSDDGGSQPHRLRKCVSIAKVNYGKTFLVSHSLIHSVDTILQ